jgi:hypothetical protein
MDVREAVGLAKKYVQEVFEDEPISDIGLEEVEFEGGDTWSITIGFSRRWGKPGGLDTLIPVPRDYKVVRISDSEKK